MASQLTEEQLEQVKAAWSLFDRDGDGSVTVAELASLYSSLGQTFTQEELGDFLQEVDSDGSGSIEWGEFLALMTRQLTASTLAQREEGLLTAFQAMDKDGDGFITMQEFKQMMTGIGTSEADVEEMVSGMDRDKDGRVTLQEYKEAFRSFLTQ